MTQEEKQLLLQDLCARLPYGVKFVCNRNVYTAKGLDLIVTDEGDWEYAVTAKGIEPIEINFIKPYLRPMESMTLEEYDELMDIPNIDIYEDGKTISNGREIDWLNKKMFDYRGLIPIGLALPATEDMYK